MGKSLRTAAHLLLTVGLAGAGMAATMVLTAATAPQAGGVVITPPDLQILVPTSDISIGTNPDTGDRQLQFTHVTWDAGPGPFVIAPHYNTTTGVSTFTQDIYYMSSPGVWRLSHAVAVATTGQFIRPSDYRFPLTRFTLNEANPDGSPGAQVAVSPKVDYCITADTYVGGVPNTPNATSPPQVNCTSPTKALGFSVGWGDEYDQTDNGQPIDLTGIPDGTYVLQATVDPEHVLTETNPDNDVVDTEVQIAGSNVTVLSQTGPTTVPPTISLTNPAPGSTLVGTVDLQSNPVATAPAGVASVQYLLDGEPLGDPVNAAPYDLSWDVGGTPPGVHTLSARVTDTDGFMGTAAVENVRVVADTTGGLSLAASAYKTGHGQLSVPLSAATGDTLVAFASLDGPAAGGQATTVSGGALTWRRVAQENSQLGDAEIWTATTPRPLAGTLFFSKPRYAYAQQFTILAFAGAGGVGATGTASGPSGASSVGLTTDAAGSLLYAVGEDWDNAIARTLGSGQTMTKQWVDTGDGDTFWVQGLLAPSSSTGQAETLNDTAPTTDQWNMAAVEVTPANPPAPAVLLVNPAKGETVSGTVPVAALPRDAAGIRSVRFLVDGHAVGPAVSTTPYSVRWNTAGLADGVHTLESVVSDGLGRSAVTSEAVDVVNPAPPMTCFVLSARSHARGVGTVTTPPIHTASAGEQLVAFAATGAAGFSRVSGAGLTWRLVHQSRATGHSVSIWAARAPHVRGNIRVTATVSGASRATVDLSVIAMEGTDGLGTAVASSSPSGTFDLTTTRDTSLVFAVGSGHDAAPLPAGWSQLDVQAGTVTTWVDYTNQPASEAGSQIQFPGSAGAEQSVVAIELPGDGS